MSANQEWATRSGCGAGFGVTRRRFLVRAGGCAAVLGMPQVAAAASLGRGGWTAPSDRIRMGFIGLGGQGTGHLLGGAWTYIPGGYAARSDVQVLAVCDVRRERRELARERCNRMYGQRLGRSDYDGVRGYRDFREVLSRDDVDAVLLALPYHWAAPMSILAARAGKDIYCEKPVAITMGQCREVVETCRRYGRVYQAGTQQRTEYGGKFRLACELVRNGRIGRLREVYAYRLPGAFHPGVWTSRQEVGVPDGFDWDLWLGPLPWRPYGGEAGHTLSGLFVGDVNWSPHHYDVVQWAIDPDPGAPVEVSARGEEVRYRLADGVVVHSSACADEPVGAEGGACFVGSEGRIAVDRSGIVARPASILTSPLRPEDERVERIESHSGNFLDCVRTRRRAICHPETAAYTMQLILAGGLALALQRELTWNPARGEFEGDEEANRLLSYSPRPPWLT